MAWHLHTVKHRLVLASLIRRYVYTSADVGCIARGACLSLYQCCLHHRFQTDAHLFQPSVNKLHTAHHDNQGTLHSDESLSHTYWPKDCKHISNLYRGDIRHEGKESSSETHCDEFQTRYELPHSRRSLSLHRDRRETRLMCINHMFGCFVHQEVHDAEDGTQTLLSTEMGSECTEIGKEMNPPLVFRFDSKGRQQMVDLLAEQNNSFDQPVFDALNSLVDRIYNKGLTNSSTSVKVVRNFRQNCVGELRSFNLSTDNAYQPVKTATPSFCMQGSTSINVLSEDSLHKCSGHQQVECTSGSNEQVNLSSGTNVPPNTEGDKPSKEQLAVVYHRLYSEIPNFYSHSHDYSMYSNNIVFDNRILNVKTKGLPAYKATIQSLKYLSTACLWKVNLEVLNLTINTEMSCIQARWRVIGVPLHRLIFFPWRKSGKKYFDAFSTFDVGSDGLIHTHTLDKLMPNPGDKVAAPSLATRIGLALGIVRPPAPAAAMQGSCANHMNLSFIKPKWLFKNRRII